MFQFLNNDHWAIITKFSATGGSGISCEVSNLANVLNNLTVKSANEEWTQVHFVDLQYGDNNDEKNNVEFISIPQNGVCFLVLE